MSVALCANAADILPELVNRGVRPDLVTDQTSAHDPLHGCLPSGWRWEVSEKRAIRSPRDDAGSETFHGGACSGDAGVQ